MPSSDRAQLRAEDPTNLTGIATGTCAIGASKAGHEGRGGENRGKGRGGEEGGAVYEEERGEVGEAPRRGTSVRDVEASAFRLVEAFAGWAELADLLFSPPLISFLASPAEHNTLC
eukprot:255495-Hanusia_phi.AAC.2